MKELIVLDRTLCFDLLRRDKKLDNSRMLLPRTVVGQKPLYKSVVVDISYKNL